MPDPSQQQILKDLNNSRAEQGPPSQAGRWESAVALLNRWTAADKLRANLAAEVYKHAVLGLIFLKYVSDSFAMRRREIGAQFRDPESEYFLDPADYGGPGLAECTKAVALATLRETLLPETAKRATRGSENL